jgi:hypothetical protein
MTIAEISLLSQRIATSVASYGDLKITDLKASLEDLRKH